MQMVWHENKIMQQVVSFVSIFQQFGNNDPRRLIRLKKEPALPCLGRNKIRPAFTRSVRQPAHKPIPQGLKPDSSLSQMSELKLRPPGALRHPLRQYPDPAHAAFVFPCKLKRWTERTIWQLRYANHATRGVTKKIAAPISTPVMVRVHSSQENDRQIKSASNIHPHTNPGNKNRNRSRVGSVGHSNDLSRNAFLHFGHSRSPSPRKTSPGPRTIL